VRHDPFARAHPLVVEQRRDARERAAYRNPELHGVVPGLSVEAGEPVLPGAVALSGFDLLPSLSAAGRAPLGESSTEIV
jgi:hypothetical protein